MIEFICEDCNSMEKYGKSNMNMMGSSMAINGMIHMMKMGSSMEKVSTKYMISRDCNVVHSNMVRHGMCSMNKLVHNNMERLSKLCNILLDCSSKEKYDRSHSNFLQDFYV